MRAQFVPIFSLTGKINLFAGLLLNTDVNLTAAFIFIIFRLQIRSFSFRQLNFTIRKPEMIKTCLG